MAYFPTNVMPLTYKQDVSGATASNVLISAEDYNLHDEEIRAIEEYLGKTKGFVGLGLPKPDVPELQVYPVSPGVPGVPGDDGLPDLSNGNILNSVSTIIDIVNNMTGFASQGSSSGYLHSGQKVIFPENVHCTGLIGIPGSNDSSINVQSTDGFPRQGVISILNDVQQAHKTSNSSDFSQTVSGGVSMVEWVRYSDKTAQQFLNCERGFAGTSRGPHSASFNAPRDTSFGRNQRDFCVLLDGIEVNICGRQWPWWRQRRRYRMPFFAIQGFKRDLIIFIVRYGASFPLNSGHDPSVAQVVIKAANDLGILTYRNEVPFLQSQNSTNRNQKRIGWVEARNFINELEDNGAVTEETSPDNLEIGNIPVFRGRVSVNYGVSAITRVSTYNIDAIQVIQTADGRVYCFLSDYANRDRTLQAVVNYESYFIAPPMTTGIRNGE